MHLNIKNDIAHALAKEIAAITGSSLTEAVTQALEERLSELRREQKEKQLRKSTGAKAVLEEIWAALPPVERRLSSRDAMDALYDEHGLPI